MQDRLEIAQALLGRDGVEQVGFLDNESTAPQFTMMGGELCVNGLLAASTLLQKQSGTIIGPNDTRISYSKNQELTNICLTLEYRKDLLADETIVLFDSIGYMVSERAPIVKGLEDKLRRSCEQWNTAAFGYIQSYGNQIKPYVYVRDTNSLVAETACGSGSVAAYLSTDAGNASSVVNIYQPTKQPIRIQKTNELYTFTISARVDRIA